MTTIVLFLFLLVVYPNVVVSSWIDDEATAMCALATAYPEHIGNNLDQCLYASNQTTVICQANYSDIYYGISIWCDDNGSVYHMDFLDFKYPTNPAPVPSQLGLLSNLQYLDMCFFNENSDLVPLPSQLGKLSALTYLCLDGRNLYGTIPTQLGQLFNLGSLKLTTNNLYGTIPTQLANMSSLVYLALSRNQLTGTIPTQFAYLKSLNFLYLPQNYLVGTLPSQLSLAGNPYGLYMDLSANSLSGTIPTEWGFSNIGGIDVGVTMVSGTIPTQLGSLNSQKLLTYLSIEFSNLSGTIPVQLGNLSLTYLNLQGNQLVGTIPIQIFSLYSLSELHLGYNSLDGSIPDFLDYDTSSLTVLELQLNQLSGSIPTELPNQLMFLDLHGNQLESTIPSTLFSYLTSLTYLDISNNKLSGSIPVEFSVPADQINFRDDTTLITRPMTYLDFSFNNLTGSIPPTSLRFDSRTYVIFPNLVYFSVANNLLSGPLPRNLFGPALGTLDVSSNRFSGDLEDYLSYLLNVKKVDLQYNNFSGPIPDFTLIKGLEELYLNNNNFSGPIPSSLPITLQTLFLQHNNLEGSLPAVLGKLPALKSLILSENGLCGCFPDEFYAPSRDWIACSLNDIPHNCSCASPTGCTVTPCDDTVQCGVDQCVLGTHQCSDRRPCISLLPGYVCGECPVGYHVDGSFACAPNATIDHSTEVLLSWLIPVVVVILVIVIIIVGIIIWRRIANSSKVDLPNSWFWDHARVVSSNYKQSDTEPVYYYQEVKDHTKEKQFLNELMEHLDFGPIVVSEAFALVTPALAINMSNNRKIQKARMTESPAQFFSEKWKTNDKSDLRNKVMEIFLEKIYTWDWNGNLKLQDSPVLPVVHGTDELIAWKIASGGFANLSTLDAGYYGKGIYFSTSAVYTTPYFVTKRLPTILICLTIPGNPFPVVEFHNDKDSFCGKHIVAGHQSHYIITVKKGYPFTAEDYEANHTPYDELVIDQEAQVVPIYLLKISKHNINDLLNEFNRELQSINNKIIEEEDRKTAEMITY